MLYMIDTDTGKAWGGNELMDPLKKAFEFHASFMAPWDGPASISFTDGKMMSFLDRTAYAKILLLRATGSNCKR